MNNLNYAITEESWFSNNFITDGSTIKRPVPQMPQIKNTNLIACEVEAPSMSSFNLILLAGMNSIDISDNDDGVVDVDEGSGSSTLEKASIGEFGLEAHS